MKLLKMVFWALVFLPSYLTATPVAEILCPAQTCKSDIAIVNMDIMISFDENRSPTPVPKDLETFERVKNLVTFSCLVKGIECSSRWFIKDVQPGIRYVCVPGYNGKTKEIYLKVKSKASDAEILSCIAAAAHIVEWHNEKGVLPSYDQGCTRSNQQRINKLVSIYEAAKSKLEGRKELKSVATFLTEMEETFNLFKAPCD